MSRSKTLFLCCAAVLCFHCGPPGRASEITLVDHADALTTTGQDVLFVITLSKATQSYESTALSVLAGLPGQSLTVMHFTLEDLNSNGKLDEGEKLTCKEPGGNVFDATTNGKSVNVSLNEKQASGTYIEIGSAIWSAN